MIIYVKYMVCLRCKLKVKEELTKLGIHYGAIDLGTVEVLEDITPEQRGRLNEALLRSGLELMDDKKAVIAERIKNVINEMVHDTEEVPRVKLSVLLSEKLGYSYTYLANIFSETKGTTIEHYLITNRVERAKELLLYDELNLTEISYRLHYSSVAHLSAQFKKVTGLTPTFFKKLKKKREVHLDAL
ncbi:MAG: helix-turn-helix transcriptional regulator [Flavobacteriales bacterium]|nr:helix-turn-helix transcriptional regulator [Flavobacteriales bacterium]